MNAYWEDRKEAALALEANNEELKVALFQAQQLIKSLTETKYMLIEQIKLTRCALERTFK